METPTMQHNGFWDCIEAETTKRLAYRRTGHDTGETGNPTHVEVRECRECGERHVVETYYGGDAHLEEFEFYGLRDEADADDVVADYLEA